MEREIYRVREMSNLLEILLAALFYSMNHWRSPISGALDLSNKIGVINNMNGIS